MSLQKTKKPVRPTAIRNKSYHTDTYNDEYGKNITVAGADNLTIPQAKALVRYLKQAIIYLEAANAHPESKK